MKTRHPVLQGPPMDDFARALAARATEAMVRAGKLRRALEAADRDFAEAARELRHYYHNVA